MTENTVILNRTENPDSLELSTPARGGAIKIYGDFSNKEEFQKKIENAIELRKYAGTLIEVA
jgi:hypothetical protein